MPPPANPVVIGDSGLPFGLNLVALPCHSESCPCQPTVKLSPTQRLPSLSNIRPPPARWPPPSNLSGRTHALGEKFRYGMYGTARIVLPCGTGENSPRRAKSPPGSCQG